MLHFLAVSVFKNEQETHDHPPLPDPLLPPSLKDVAELMEALLGGLIAAVGVGVALESSEARILASPIVGFRLAFAELVLLLLRLRLLPHPFDVLVGVGVDNSLTELPTVPVEAASAVIPVEGGVARIKSSKSTTSETCPTVLKSCSRCATALSFDSLGLYARLIVPREARGVTACVARHERELNRSIQVGGPADSKIQNAQKARGVLIFRAIFGGLLARLRHTAARRHHTRPHHGFPD